MNPHRKHLSRMRFEYDFVRHQARGVGHTQAALAGVRRDPNAVLIVRNDHQARRIRKDNPGVNVLSIQEAERGTPGSRRAIVMDIDAVYMMQLDYEQYIQDIDKEAAHKRESLMSQHTEYQQRGFKQFQEVSDKLEASRTEVAVLRQCLINRDDKIMQLEQEATTPEDERSKTAQYAASLKQLAAELKRAEDKNWKLNNERVLAETQRDTLAAEKHQQDADLEFSNQTRGHLESQNEELRKEVKLLKQYMSAIEELAELGANRE
jgi:chromosome segregation ATPase